MGISVTLTSVLLALAAVIAAGQALGWLMRKLGQPAVIGEVLAGILLGPSLLGPEISDLILPSNAAPTLQMIAQLGVVLYLFTVGLELNLGSLQRQASSVLVISAAGMVLPFLLGLALATVLYKTLAPTGVGFLAFSLFTGVAMSVTAFPVLARILTDRNLQKTAVGELALNTAAFADVLAWCLLALIVGIVSARTGEGAKVVLFAALYLLVMFMGVRPLMAWLSRRYIRSAEVARVSPWVLVGLLLSALATEGMGIHAMFGAFLLGALIPHESPLAKSLHDQLRTVVVVFLLPAFFAYTGMRTRIDLVQGAEQWLLCGVIIVLASVGKLGGTWLAARWMKQSPENALSLAVMMNTRGLMEIIVLNVGLELGVISPTMYSMFVIMALVTTLATAPLLNWIARRSMDNPLPAR